MKKTYIVPLDGLIVRKYDPEATESKIILPENAHKKTQFGEVVFVGQGVLLESGEYKPMLMAPGDKVIFHMSAGDAVMVNGEKLHWMGQSDIRLIIKEHNEQATENS